MGRRKGACSPFDSVREDIKRDLEPPRGIIARGDQDTKKKEQKDLLYAEVSGLSCRAIWGGVKREVPLLGKFEGNKKVPIPKDHRLV